MRRSGRILEWSRERGFGWLECHGRRIFLHRREFQEGPTQPDAGDVIHFVLGADKQGRPCAQRAVQANDGGRRRAVHFLVLAVLLVLPGWAADRGLGPVDAGWLAGWCAAFSTYAFLILARDKRRAREKTWRESEKTLHWIEFAGGWPGAFLAQRWLRHKSSKMSYQFYFWLIVGLYQFVAAESLLGWPVTRKLLGRAS
jgi:uncharacterized membrane protein YsdA (DUF1294 family)